MTLEQFKEALIAQGYKLRYRHLVGYYHMTSFQYRNKRISIQEWENCTNVFYSKDFKNGSYEYNQHRVVDYKKVLSNIKRFEKRLGI